jgi:hypothetical protein
VFTLGPATVAAADGARVEVLPPSPTPAQAVAGAPAAFVAFTAPGDRPDVARLAALADVLAADPVPVLAFGRAEPTGAPADPVLHPWAFPLSEGPGLVDGRLLAAGVLHHGANVLGPAAVVVVRASAVDERDGLPGTAEEPGAHLALWLALLARGPAWYDPALAATTDGDADDIPVWDALVRGAVHAGLLLPEEAAAALVARLARVGVVAQRHAADGGVAGDRLPTALRGLAAALDDATVVPRPDIDALVLADADHVAARTSATAAAWARRVVVADRSGDSLPDEDLAGAEWTSADWGGADSAALLTTGERPVLVVAAGELAEVLDAGQLAAVGRAAGDGFAAEVAGSASCEVRLVSPGPGADARIGRASDVRVHSVHLASPDGPDWLPVPATGTGRSRRFLIAAPGFRADSGGVVALHRLCDVLNRLGHDAALLPLEAGAATNPGWRTPIVADASAVDGAVVVYPEIIRGNPLGATRVVRWLLNRPGHVSGQPLDAGPGDLLVSWNAAIDPSLPVLAVPLFDPKVFFPKDVRGSGALLWVGKGRLPATFPRAGTTLVTRAWPASRPRLAAVLRAADVLYSCDWMTALAYEALLCGTPVVLVGDQQWAREALEGNGLMLPGMVFEGGDLDAARAAVGETTARYRAQVAAAAEDVAAFVALAERHFGLDEARAPLVALDQCG